MELKQMANVLAKAAVLLGTKIDEEKIRAWHKYFESFDISTFAQALKSEIDAQKSGWLPPPNAVLQRINTAKWRYIAPSLTISADEALLPQHKGKVLVKQAILESHRIVGEFDCQRNYATPADLARAKAIHRAQLRKTFLARFTALQSRAQDAANSGAHPTAAIVSVCQDAAAALPANVKELVALAQKGHIAKNAHRAHISGAPTPRYLEQGKNATVVQKQEDLPISGETPTPHPGYPREEGT